MNHSKPTQSRVPHRDVALYASFLGFLIIVSIAFSACSPASNETPAASANASPSASDQTEARRQIEARYRDLASRGARRLRSHFGPLCGRRAHTWLGCAYAAGETRSCGVPARSVRREHAQR